MFFLSLLLPLRSLLLPLLLLLSLAFFSSQRFPGSIFGFVSVSSSAPSQTTLTCLAHMHMSSQRSGDFCEKNTTPKSKTVLQCSILSGFVVK